MQWWSSVYMKNEVTKKRDYYRTLPYEIVLRKDEEGDWVARIKELPGCTAHGRTQIEALKSLDEVMEAWLEDALESGAAIPEPRIAERLPSGKWLQRVPRFLHKKLVETAEWEEVSLNQLVTSMLSEAIGRRSGPGRKFGTEFQTRQMSNLIIHKPKRAIALKKETFK
jgi:predicted RNase H-like HicB family nuclease